MCSDDTIEKYWLACMYVYVVDSCPAETFIILAWNRLACLHHPDILLFVNRTFFFGMPSFRRWGIKKKRAKRRPTAANRKFNFMHISYEWNSYKLFGLYEFSFTIWLHCSFKNFFIYAFLFILCSCLIKLLKSSYWFIYLFCFLLFTKCFTKYPKLVKRLLWRVSSLYVAIS